MLFFLISFPFQNLGNGFFSIPFTFPNFGNGIFHSRSRSSTPKCHSRSPLHPGSTKEPPIWGGDQRIHQGATTLRLSAAGLLAPQFSLDRLGGNLWKRNCRNLSGFELQANNLITVKICITNSLSKHSINTWLLMQDFGPKYKSFLWSEEPHQIQNK